MKLILDRTAVEALIGGNTEAEIEIRNSIVQAFAKRHLRDVVASDVFSEFLAEEKDAVTRAFDAAVEKHIGKVRYGDGGRHLTPSPTFEKELNNYVNTLISEKINEVTEKVSALLDEKLKCYLESLDSQIEHLLKIIHTEVLEQKVRNRFEALLAATKPE